MPFPFPMIASSPLLAGIRRAQERVGQFRERARRFYYAVMLFAHPCPRCKGQLALSRAGTARCKQCQRDVDLTVEFQRSPCCHAELRLRKAHYACSACDRTVPSRFLFDERIHDACFAERMRQSREGKRRRRAELTELLLASRSGSLVTGELPDVEAVPGLVESLNAFVGAPGPVDRIEFLDEDCFDHHAYWRTIREYVQSTSIMFSAIPALCSDVRKDRARRFVTLVHMWHESEVCLTQYGNDLLVEKYEVDGKGC